MGGDGGGSLDVVEVCASAARIASSRTTHGRITIFSPAHTLLYKMGGKHGGHLNERRKWGVGGRTHSDTLCPARCGSKALVRAWVADGRQPTVERTERSRVERPGGNR